MKYLKPDFSVAHTHSDLAILCRYTGTNPADLRGSFHGGPEPYEANYMKVYFLRNWTENAIENLSKQFAEANSKTTEYNFVIDDLSDYEVEYDNDRTWPASFGFKTIKK